MDGMHWTGAALLLALAVLGGRTTPVEREPIVSWTEFAREHGLTEEDSPGSRRACLDAFRAWCRLARPR